MAKKSPIKPLGTRVLLREIEGESEQGGILLPDEAKDAGSLRWAEVIALGEGVGSEEEKVKLAVGDKVLIDGFAGKEIKIKGHEYLIAKSIDILGVVTN